MTPELQTFLLQQLTTNKPHINTLSTWDILAISHREEEKNRRSQSILKQLLESIHDKDRDKVLEALDELCADIYLRDKVPKIRKDYITEYDPGPYTYLRFENIPVYIVPER